MPQLVLIYTPNLEPEVDFTALCRGLADAMLTVKDEQGQPVFPTGGVRVLAFPAAHFAVADGSGDYGFCYFNLRMGRGRREHTQQSARRIVSQTARQLLSGLLARRRVGLTFQVDVGQEVFDAKFGNLHPLFAPT